MSTQEPLVIKVIHKMRNKNLPRTHYVGRPTVLGNPYTHFMKSTLADIKVDTLEEAVYAYQDYIDEQIDDGNERIINALNTIIDDAEKGGTIHLSCWCKDEVTPFQSDSKLCHADVIRNIILDELGIEDE